MDRNAMDDLIDKRVKKRTKRIEKTLLELAEQLQKDNKKDKKVKKTREIVWNREGHRIQYEFIRDTLDALSDIEEDIDKGVDRDDCTEKVKKLKKSVKYRGKLVRMADQEEGGWETVRAYERSSIAEDEEDDRKIKNAIATAKRKIRERSESTAKRRKIDWGKSQGERKGAAFQPTATISAPQQQVQPMIPNHVPFAFQSTPLQAPFRRGGPGMPQKPGPRDICFRCGSPGHWSAECPNKPRQ